MDFYIKQSIDPVYSVHRACRVRRPKWPKRLEMSAKQNFEENQFYCCVYEGSKRWQHFMLFCVVAAVLKGLALEIEDRGLVYRSHIADSSATLSTAVERQRPARLN
ncbi:translocation protein sec62, putative [Eimeria acervulina]|uniref:Translocation protein sec62, putative n=1 Tax=Eimeria acervulina TaxID=5801 RepID=U6G8Q1_EIMAC|nr:translocation protein sec62, putative [Eimeria acervulina]CDI76621.1 translocation protein sec62, putative [Eimeria acervulina]